MKRVKDYMKEDVITFGPHDSLFDVAEIMSKNGVSGAPVIEGRNLVGIISVSDLMKFMQVRIPELENMVNEPHSLSMMVAGLVKERIEFQMELKKLSKNMVKDFMNKDVISITPEAPLIECAEIMDKNDVERLPVINDKDKLVGIISRTDIVRALFD